MSRLSGENMRKQLEAFNQSVRGGSGGLFSRWSYYPKSQPAAELLQEPFFFAPMAPGSESEAPHRDPKQKTQSEEGKPRVALDEEEGDNNPLKHAITQMSRGMAAVAEALTGGVGTAEFNPLVNKDLQFLEWDWNPNTLASWISDSTYRIETRGTSEVAAIRYAKLTLSPYLKNSMPEAHHRTWKEFVEFLKTEFYPVNWAIQVQLNLILRRYYPAEQQPPEVFE